jgi:predicted porin
MNKALALTVLAAASSACVAQVATPNSVTLYGIVDAGISRVSGLKNGTDTALVSGIMEGSRFGLRGNEDIGGGYRAIFTLENRTELNNGSLSNRSPSGTQVPDRLNQAALLGLPGALQPAVSGVAAQIGSTIGVNLGNAFWDRQAYVGLVTPFGGLVAGRQYTPGYEISATFDTLGTQSSLAAGQVGAIPSSVKIRASNAVQYRIQLGGITAGAMYAFGGVAGNSKANRFAGVMAMYKGAGFSVGGAYNQENNEVGLKSLKSVLVGGSLDVGPGKASALYGQIKDDNPAGVSTIAAGLTPLVGAAGAALVQSAFTTALKQDAHQFHIGYKLETGPNTFYVAYNSYNDRKAANADVTSYGVAYTYALSKRTDLNAVLTRFDNKGLGQAAPGQAGSLGGVTASAATDSTGLAFGIRHRF